MAISLCVRLVIRQVGHLGAGAVGEVGKEQGHDAAGGATAARAVGVVGEADVLPEGAVTGADSVVEGQERCVPDDAAPVHLADRSGDRAVEGGERPPVEVRAAGRRLDAHRRNSVPGKGSF